MRKRCGNCFWFNNKFQYGRFNRASCSELGSQEQEADCGDWKSRSGLASDMDVDRILASAGVHVDPDSEVDSLKARKAFLDILTELFHNEQDFAAVIQKIKDAIEQQSYKLPFKHSLLVGLYGKVSELKFLHQICLAMGMGSYSDKILANHIDYLFPQNRPATPPVSGPVSRVTPLA